MDEVIKKKRIKRNEHIPVWNS